MKPIEENEDEEQNIEDKEELKALEKTISQMSDNVKHISGRHKDIDEKKSLERKRKRADKCAEAMSLRTILRKMLEANDNERANNIVNALIGNAEMGDTKSFEVIYKVLYDEIGHDEDNNPLQPVKIELSFTNNAEGIRDKE